MEDFRKSFLVKTIKLPPINLRNITLNLDNKYLFVNYNERHFRERSISPRPRNLKNFPPIKSKTRLFDRIE